MCVCCGNTIGRIIGVHPKQKRLVINFTEPLVRTIGREQLEQYEVGYISVGSLRQR